MTWNQIANIKGPPGDPGTGGGPAAWAGITGRPGLLGSDGPAVMYLPGKWNNVHSIGPSLDTQAGTVDHPLPSNAGLRASLPRWSLTGSGSAVAIGQYGSHHTAMVSHSGSATGGFTYRVRCSVVSALAAQRGFVGLLSYQVNSAGEEPYNGPDNIGLAFNAATDANYQLVCHPDYGALTKQDAGSGFAVGDTNAVLDLTLKNAPGSGAVTWRLRDLNSGANASGAFTSNLPGATKALCHKNFMNCAGGTGLIGMELMFVYLGPYVPD